MNNKWFLIRFTKLLNSNILVSSEGTKILQKSLFSQNFYVI